MVNGPPRRHHYVPQFFSKAWGINPQNSKNVKLKVITADNREITVNTKDIFLERDLYQLDNEIEESFITPYIDSLDNSIQKIRQHPWSTLSDVDKQNVLKFLLLLDARSPDSIRDMKQGCELYIEKCREIFQGVLNDDFVKAFLAGVENGVLILVLTAIDEIGLDDFKKSKNKSHIFERIKNLIDACKKSGLWVNKYIDNLKKARIFEFETIDKQLLSCNSPVYRHGKYDKDFSIAVNLSPTKALFISNEDNLIRPYLGLDNQGKIDFFNKMVNLQMQKGSSLNKFIVLNP
jgi:hypothetical protein